MTGEQLQILLVKEGITPCSVEHHGQRRIKLIFKNTAQLTEAVKRIPGRKWSKTMQAWHIPKDKRLLERLIRSLSFNSSPLERGGEQHLEVAIFPKQITENKTGVPLILNAVNIEDELKTYIQQFVDKLLLKAYSYNTVKNYRSHFHSFLHVLAKGIERSIKPGIQPDFQTVFAKTLNDATQGQLEKYLRWRQNQKNYSESDQNTHINALKFYYEQVLNRPRMLFNLPRPKKPKKLPVVWAEEDVVKLINAIKYPKHRLMLVMAYAHGMRVSEVASLKLADMDSKRMQIHLKGAKGKKDRIVNLSPAALEAIKNYYKKFKPKIYLFENEETGEPISLRTIQKVFEYAKQRAGLHKKAGIHSLRHSYATHLHEHGVDIKFLKELLGHSSLKTTETYTHVSKRDISKIVSPLDTLKL